MSMRNLGLEFLQTERENQRMSMRNLCLEFRLRERIRELRELREGIKE